MTHDEILKAMSEIQNEKDGGVILSPFQLNHVASAVGDIIKKALDSVTVGNAAAKPKGALLYCLVLIQTGVEGQATIGNVPPEDAAQVLRDSAEAMEAFLGPPTDADGKARLDS